MALQHTSSSLQRFVTNSLFLQDVNCVCNLYNICFATPIGFLHCSLLAITVFWLLCVLISPAVKYLSSSACSSPCAQCESCSCTSMMVVVRV